jgi:hypothetical protein
MFFGQTALTLHVKHQISTIDELDNEEQSATHEYDTSVLMRDSDAHF